MHVLVTAASKHEATAGIAQAIGLALVEAGLEVTVTSAAEVDTVDPYDAVILGSAVYMGHWLEPARKLVDRHREALAARPIWLFSSGPIGDPPRPDGDPADVATLMDQTRARGHRVFPGRIERRRLGLAETLVKAAVHAQDGDHRPWGEISLWAHEIVVALRRERPGPAPG